jgi:hypothetical protein
MPRCNKNELSLTIYSNHREPGSSIGAASYIIDNGPLYINSMAVKSATLYNTAFNIEKKDQLIEWTAKSILDNFYIFSHNITPGFYTSQQLANYLQIAMLDEMEGKLTDNTLSVTYSSDSNQMSFDFDNLHDYSSNIWIITVQNLVLQFNIQHGVPLYQLTTLPVSGTFTGFQLATLLEERVNRAMVSFPLDPAGGLTIIFDEVTRKFTFQPILTNPLYEYSVQPSFLGSILGLQGQASPFLLNDPWTAPGVSVGVDLNILQRSPIDRILNFENGGIIGQTNWTSGSVNLGGPMYLRFSSTKLSDKNHRMITNKQDTAFWSMPLTSSYRQLLHYREPELTWIVFDGGIEVSEIDIRLTDEDNHPVELANDYILELIIRQAYDF